MPAVRQNFGGLSFSNWARLPQCTEDASFLTSIFHKIL